MTVRKTMLLTGASRGIGHATVKHFGSAGWRVLTVSRQPFDANCPWPEGRANHVQLDLADVNQMESAIEEIRSRLDGGKLDAIVNNAAISPKAEGGARMGVLQSDYATWLRVFNVNLFSTALIAKGLYPELKAAKGIVVNVTSIVGSRVHPFAGPAYAASKAALMALTREMAHEFAPDGVRVNAIAPGEIDTSILSPGTDEIVQRDIPLRRLGKPEEVAATIYFLCTSGAAYINGAEIPINGGQHV
ncbi:SDR family NAD(P)-dependent oxidoreductase [Bordetella genomosp. 12]|uniref:Oxidoreductase n=1 Tax=Bordetella genomosp. 12 TaxID=463035 RepID=A0A261VAX5_9BORD|nr:SDR family oxidoreductase [Bordetella genomosp. 12]OZI70911.1 oxidoreductase [Bordetella genomosp. 12]